MNRGGGASSRKKKAVRGTMITEVERTHRAAKSKAPTLQRSGKTNQTAELHKTRENRGSKKKKREQRRQHVGERGGRSIRRTLRSTDSDHSAGRSNPTHKRAGGEREARTRVRGRKLCWRGEKKKRKDRRREASDSETPTVGAEEKRKNMRAAPKEVWSRTRRVPVMERWVVGEEGGQRSR